MPLYPLYAGTTGVWQNWVGTATITSQQMLSDPSWYAWTGAAGAIQTTIVNVQEVWMRWVREDAPGEEPRWREDGEVPVISTVWQMWAADEIQPVPVPRDKRDVVLPPYQRPVTDSPEMAAARAEKLKRDQWTARRNVLVQKQRSNITRIRKRLAAVKARELLLEHLDDRQREEYLAGRSFHVETAGGARRYRIEYGIAGNIRLIETAGEHPPLRRGGALRPGMRFCYHGYHPDGSIPQEDHMLAQKWMIEACEDEFLAGANIS